jgi:hypothetical protein
LVRGAFDGFECYELYGDDGDVFANWDGLWGCDGYRDREDEWDDEGYWDGSYWDDEGYWDIYKRDGIGFEFDVYGYGVRRFFDRLICSVAKEWRGCAELCGCVWYFGSYGCVVRKRRYTFEKLYILTLVWF